LGFLPQLFSSIEVVSQFGLRSKAMTRTIMKLITVLSDADRLNLL
jgi:hypothetical protein